MPKESKYDFIGGMFNSEKRNDLKAFDWDKAAQIIKEQLKIHPGLIAEAGLQGDWDYTGGVIFKNGEPYDNADTYLSSTWAIPTLIIFDGLGDEVLEMECWTEESDRFHSGSKWDSTSIDILNS